MKQFLFKPVIKIEHIFSLGNRLVPQHTTQHLDHLTATQNIGFNLVKSPIIRLLKLMIYTLYGYIVYVQKLCITLIICKVNHLIKISYFFFKK